MGEFRFLFTAADFEATTAFLRDTLGLALHHGWDDETGRGAIFHCGGGLVEVFGAPPGEPGPAPSGVALAVEWDGVDAWCATLAGRGVRVLSPPSDKPWGHRSFQIDTPDGVPVTFFEQRA